VSVGYLVMIAAMEVVADSQQPAGQTRRPLPPPQAIRERVAKAGPMNAVSEIADPTPEVSAWPLLIERVAEGAKEWLEVAELLAPGTDAGYSLELASL
jgi:hypothetical protein